MNENPRDDTDDDLRRLFQRTGPQAEPVDVDRLLANVSVDSRRSTGEGLEHKSKISLRTATFIAIAASLALLLAIPFASTDSHAFAQVKEQVERVRTVDYIETQYFDMPDEWYEQTFGTREHAQSWYEDVIASLEGRLADAHGDTRQDIQLQIDVLTTFLGKEPKLLPGGIRRVRIKGKRLERSDELLSTGHTHQVTDAKENMIVLFDHTKKSRTVLKRAVTIHDGSETEEPIDISPAVDFFQRFRKVPTDAAERIGRKTFSGKEAIGFRRIQKQENGTWTTVYWIDPKSNLPIRIEREWDGIEDEAKTRWVKDRFVFDGELDDALFSTDTPDGYGSKDGKIYGVEL